MRDNIIILLIFGAGVLIGMLDLMPGLVEADISLYLLYLLMFFVGMSIGNDSNTLQSFKHLPKKALALPFLTIIGSAVGGLLTALILRENVFEMLGVSAGLGYYSLSSVILTEQIGATVAAIALLSNILRELLTILLAPLLVRFFGPLSVISAGGATTMDVTLPFILKASGERYLITSVYHGFVCDLSVPFLVTFFASLA